MSAKPHLAAMDADIRLLAEAGMSAPEIASTLKCCPSGVRKYCSRNKIELVNIKDVFRFERDKFLACIKTNRDAASLAATFQVTPSTIRKWAVIVGESLTDTFHPGYSIHNGYIHVRIEDHPSAAANGYVRLHRLVMEHFLGRYLEKHEIVHHIDGNKLNNTIENLELMTLDDHAKLHASRGDTGWAVYHQNSI